MRLAASIRRQPAEWEPHSSTWLAWPSHAELWGDALTDVRLAFVELCRAIADPQGEAEVEHSESLNVVVLNEAGEEEARDALTGLVKTFFHKTVFGDIWLRDTAPVFVEDQMGDALAVLFHFNGWGEKYRLAGDDALSNAIADFAGIGSKRVQLVAEGGAIDVDGEGTCITTRQCLLNPNRNPRLSEKEVEDTLHEAIGATRVIWLDEGLANDHTDGHVDNLARFVGSARVACMVGERDDPNYGVLKEIKGRLSVSRDASGRKLELIELPSPGAIKNSEGSLMPASYMNFYVSNRSVVVPMYGTPSDHKALDAISSCFPGRRVLGVDARRLLEGGGAFHCITQQQPLLKAGR